MVICVCAFRHLQLAKDYDACLPQASDNAGIVRGPIVAKNRCTRGSGNILHPTQILDAHGHAVQRATIAARSDLKVGGPGCNKGIIGENHRITIEIGVDLSDPLKLRLGRFDRRDATLPQEACEFA